MKLGVSTLGGWALGTCLLWSPTTRAAPQDTDASTEDRSDWEAPADAASPSEDATESSADGESPTSEADPGWSSPAEPRVETIPQTEGPSAHGSDASESVTPEPPPSPDAGEVAPGPEGTKPEDPWAAPTPGQLGVAVGVPFFDEDILHGDMTVDVRYGRKIGWLVPYVSGGFRQTRLDPARVPDHARRKKLEAWHLTLGIRLEIPASRHLFPFVGVAGELSRWGFQANTAEFCHEPFYPEAWRCYERYQWKPGRAFKPQVGLIYKPEPSLALEFWVEHGTVDAPEMFTRQVTFITPGLGFAWHH